MSFWSQCPGPSWTDCFWSFFSCGGIPIAQPIRREPLLKPQTNQFHLTLAKVSEADQITGFLKEHFHITKTSKCELPLERLKQGLLTGWIFVIARDIEHQKIIGTVASRPLGTLLFCLKEDSETKISKFSSSDSIDFFCIDPAFRKSGLGSDLLRYIDYYSCQKGRPIHFFQKEITPLFSIPPIWSGTYIVRETTRSGAYNPTIQYLPLPKTINQSDGFSIRFQNNQLSQDSKYIRYDCGNFILYVAITNTYHMYKNAWMGEVLFYQIESTDPIEEKSIAAALEEVIENSSYRYMLMDESIPHLRQMNWKKDAPYYIYAYNVNPRRFFSVKPEFWF